MRFGIAFANVGPFAEPEVATGLGRLAEDHGLESLWTVEHVVVPSGYASRYPYSSSGRMPGNDDFAIPDPLVWLTWVGAGTTTIKLATGILILPQRNPVVLAKEVATLDVLSRGRVVLGVGVGWLREEFDAIGVPFEARGARTDEYIEAMRALWREGESTFAGEYARFDALNSYPKPTGGEGPPIVIGGHTEAAARRAGRIGDGFFPAKGDLDHLIGVMRAAAVDAGRDPDTIEVTAGGAMDVDGIRALGDKGVSRVMLPPLGFDLATLATQLDAFSQNVIAKLA